MEESNEQQDLDENVDEFQKESPVNLNHQTDSRKIEIDKKLESLSGFQGAYRDFKRSLMSQFSSYTFVVYRYGQKQPLNEIHSTIEQIAKVAVVDIALAIEIGIPSKILLVSAAGRKLYKECYQMFLSKKAVNLLVKDPKDAEVLCSNSYRLCVYNTGHHTRSKLNYFLNLNGVDNEQEDSEDVGNDEDFSVTQLNDQGFDSLKSIVNQSGMENVRTVQSIVLDSLKDTKLRFESYFSIGQNVKNILAQKAELHNLITKKLTIVYTTIDDVKKNGEIMCKCLTNMWRRKRTEGFFSDLYLTLEMYYQLISCYFGITKMSKSFYSGTRGFGIKAEILEEISCKLKVSYLASLRIQDLSKYLILFKLQKNKKFFLSSMALLLCLEAKIRTGEEISMHGFYGEFFRPVNIAICDMVSEGSSNSFKKLKDVKLLPPLEFIQKLLQKWRKNMFKASFLNLLMQLHEHDKQGFNLLVKELVNKQYHFSAFNNVYAISLSSSGQLEIEKLVFELQR